MANNAAELARANWQAIQEKELQENRDAIMYVFPTATRLADLPSFPKEAEKQAFCLYSRDNRCAFWTQEKAKHNNKLPAYTYACALRWSNTTWLIARDFYGRIWASIPAAKLMRRMFYFRDILEKEAEKQAFCQIAGRDFTFAETWRVFVDFPCCTVPASLAETWQCVDKEQQGYYQPLAFSYIALLESVETSNSIWLALDGNAPKDKALLWYKEAL